MGAYAVACGDPVGTWAQTAGPVAEQADAADLKSAASVDNAGLTADGQRHAQRADAKPTDPGQTQQPGEPDDVQGLAEKLAKLSPEARAALRELLG